MTFLPMMSVRKLVSAWLDSFDSFVKRILKIGSAQGFKRASGEGRSDGIFIKIFLFSEIKTRLCLSPTASFQKTCGKYRAESEKTVVSINWEYGFDLQPLQN